MGDPAHPPAAAPEKPAAPSGKSGGPSLGVAWGGVILFMVLVFSGVLTAFGQQVAMVIGIILQVFKMNMGPILGLIAVIWAYMAIKNKK